MLLTHTNFINKHRGPSEYPASPHRWGVSVFTYGSFQRGLWARTKSPLTGRRQDRTIFLTPCLATSPAGFTAPVSGIKSGINSHIDKMTVALFAQLQSLAMDVYSPCVRSFLKSLLALVSS
jgi:hypothetical protein